MFPAHAMRVYGGGGITPLILNVSARRRRVLITIIYIVLNKRSSCQYEVLGRLVSLPWVQIPLRECALFAILISEDPAEMPKTRCFGIISGSEQVRKPNS